MKKFIIYCCRWQLSSIILAPCIAMIPNNALLAAIVANFVGASIFFWFDRIIFTIKN